MKFHAANYRIAGAVPQSRGLNPKFRNGNTVQPQKGMGIGK